MDHVDLSASVPHRNSSAVHHFNCTENFCKSVWVDMDNGNVHFMSSIPEVGMMNVVLTASELLEAMIFVSEAPLNCEHDTEDQKEAS